MILGPVSLLDCAVFVLLLAPQLVRQAGFRPTLFVALKALPFLVIELPVQLFRSWAYPRKKDRFAIHDKPPKGPSLFQETAIRCVRYAFKNVPPNVGRVFFSKEVALPFLKFRMWRHGYRDNGVLWRELDADGRQPGGIWVMHDEKAIPDIVVYYIHGGGFALGSAYFYLEFLLAWHALLLEAGYRNPAVFALEYTLVPDAAYPEQMVEAALGYGHVVRVARDASRVCIAADSAGAILALSLLRRIGDGRRRAATDPPEIPPRVGDFLDGLPRPELAVLISPWVTLVSDRHKNTEEDYLDGTALWRYALAYAGATRLHHREASPGSGMDGSAWRQCAPGKGYYVVYGRAEMLAADIRMFVDRQNSAGKSGSRSRSRSRSQGIRAVEVGGRVHAWPVASLFLGETKDERLEGLNGIVSHIAKCMPIGGNGTR